MLIKVKISNHRGFPLHMKISSSKKDHTVKLTFGFKFKLCDIIVSNIQYYIDNQSSVNCL